MQATVSMNEENNAAEDFGYTRRQWNRPMKVEYKLRGNNIGLPLACIIVASISLKKMMLGNSALPSDIQGSDYNYYSKCYTSSIQKFTNLNSSTHAVASWILFFSLVVLIYQIFALLQIFFYLKVLYMKIPLGKSLWYLFPLIDIGINIVVIIGYLPAAIALAVYSYQWAEQIIVKDRLGYCILNFVLPSAFTCIFAFGCAIHSIVMIFFIIFAKIQLKWPNFYVPEN